MIHPDTYLGFVDARRGHGVFAQKLIPRGTVVWLHDELDQVLSPARVAALPPPLRAQVERYAYVNADGNRVLCWDHGRYMNHSCEPSTTSIGTLMEIARRDIQAGEELTCEYGLDYVVQGFVCSCGAPSCRGALQPTDRQAVRQRWDREAQEAFAWALTVAQPLLLVRPVGGPGQPSAADAIVQAIAERRSLTLPSWESGVPGGA